MTDTEAFIRALPAHDQIWLLTWLCEADPDLAARGAGAVIERHAACARTAACVDDYGEPRAPERVRPRGGDRPPRLRPQALTGRAVARAA